MVDIESIAMKKQPKKSVKKIQEPRVFNKVNSVFRDYREDLDVERKQWEYDMNLTKCNRFIKDTVELERVNQVLLKYYRALRDQFFA